MNARLMRSLARWRKCDPKAMAEQSAAALTFAFADAQHDIALLAAQRDTFAKALQAAMRAVDSMKQEAETGAVIGDEIGMRDALAEVSRQGLAAYNEFHAAAASARECAP